jgi:predicted nucleic acid-binding protein
MDSCVVDLDLKRSALFGARIRFSPTGATARDQAIQRILEQNLASVGDEEGLTEQHLTQSATMGYKPPILRAADVRRGIEELRQASRVEEKIVAHKKIYVLSSKVQEEVSQSIKEAEKRNATALKELFGNAPGNLNHYSDAFLQLLCALFSKLSEVYVHGITMEPGAKDLGKHQLFQAILDEVLKTHQVPDIAAFKYGVNRFFLESTPLYYQIKWNMAQNFYVIKALGLDSSFDLLSADAFRDTSLYCDTNVLIAGLTPDSRHHNSFLELSESCRNLGMTLKVTEETINELRGVIAAYVALLRKVIDRIPNATQPRIRNFLFESYLMDKERDPALTLDEFIFRFEAPLEALQATFGINVESDQWFDDMREQNEVKKLVRELSKQYEDSRGKPKREGAARHDALYLLWVAKENKESKKSWALTLDVSLAEWSSRNPDDTFRVITLDALIQWITPVSAGIANEDRLAEIFSQAIRYQLLPREVFFDLRDFQVFAEMGIETKQLPAQDVEACIREIRRVGPRLDPGKADDRERIGQIISRYFVDPGTKFRRDIQGLETQTDQLGKKLESETHLRKEAEEKLNELESQIVEKERQFEKERLVREAAERRIDDLEKGAQHRSLVFSTILRSLLALIILAIVEGVIAISALRWGEGANFFQRLTKSSWWLAGGFGLTVGIWRLLLGKKRWALLIWWRHE